MMPRGAMEVFGRGSIWTLKDQGSWSCWWSLETNSTIVYVSQGGWVCSMVMLISRSLGKPQYLYLVSQEGMKAQLFHARANTNFTLYQHILFICHKHISWIVPACKMVLMHFTALLLLKQAALVTFRSILQNIVQGIIINAKPGNLQDLPTVKWLLHEWMSGFWSTRAVSQNVYGILWKKKKKTIHRLFACWSAQLVEDGRQVRGLLH